MRRPTTLLLFAVGVALSGCGGGAGPTDATADKALNVPAPEELMQAGPLGERVLGNPNAPVTVIEYASLTCPHTASFQKDVFPRVKKELIDTGKIRFIVREFPIGHTSGTAAIINRCAPEISLFNAFLLRQPEWVSQEVRPDAIYSVAKSSGLPREAFDKCLTNQTIIDGTTGFGSPGQGRYIHPLRQRVITPHKAARIQGYPYWFDFAPNGASTRKSLGKWIGDAVHPILGYAAGLAAIKAVDLGC